MFVKFVERSSTKPRKCPRKHCGGSLLYVDYEDGERYLSCHLCGRSVEQTRRTDRDASNKGREEINRFS